MEDERTERLIADAIEADDPVPAFRRERVWRGIESRLDRGSRTGGRMLRLLVAASLFLAGIAVGSLASGTGSVPVPQQAPVSAPGSAAIEIQSTGSAFLASLTRLQASDEATDAESVQARSAALAVVQGTAAELLRLDPADRTAFLALRAVAGERRPSSSPARPTVWTTVEF